MIRFVSTLLFIASYILGFSQTLTDSAYVAATIQLKNGAVTSGLLKMDDAKEWSQQVIFKPTETALATVYPPDSLQSFTVLKNNIRFESLPFELTQENTNKVAVQRFGQLLVEGAYNLYRIELLRNEFDANVRGSADYLYLLINEKDTLQLDVMRIKGTGNSKQVSERYKNILNYAYNNCPTINTDVVQFNDAALVKSVIAYSSCQSVGSIVYFDETKKKYKSEHRAIGYYNGSGDEEYRDFWETGLGYHITLARMASNNNIGFTTGIEFSFRKFYWIQRREEFSQTYIHVPLYLEYRMINMESSRLTAQLGVKLAPVLSSDPTFIQTNLREDRGNPVAVHTNLVYDINAFRLFVGYAGFSPKRNTADGIWSIGIGVGGRLN